MHYRCLAVLLLASFAAGQAPSTTPSQPASKPAAPSTSAAKAAAPSGAESVVPETPVITIEGVCDTPKPAATAAAAKKAAPADCKTVVTRAQFDALANALQPNMNPATKRKLADLYPKMLIMAHSAKQRGLENDPKFKQILQFARLQILSQELSRSMKEDADKVPPAEIEKYYKDNSAAFEQATLQRLFIPKDKQAAESGDDGEEAAKQEAAKSPDAQKAADGQKAAANQKADEEAMKKEADSLQARATAGEDFDKLQKEAYDAAGLKGTPPATSIGKLTPSEVPVTHRPVMDLKPGQVSQMFAEGNGYYIYKLVSKEVKPLDQARDEIRNTLAQQRMQDAMEKIQQAGKTQLNEAYFTAPAPPQMAPGMPGMGPGGRPGPGAMMPGARPKPTPQSGQGGAPSQTAPPQGQTSTPQAQSNPSNPDSSAPKN
jgi:PPIC-type PPIASE domain